MICPTIVKRRPFRILENEGGAQSCRRQVDLVPSVGEDASNMEIDHSVREERQTLILLFNRS